ncbi:MAG: hypothetical protein U1G07_16865 [Verrucomicrobiota bacterium]
MVGGKAALMVALAFEVAGLHGYPADHDVDEPASAAVVAARVNVGVVAPLTLPPSTRVGHFCAIDTSAHRPWR